MSKAIQLSKQMSMQDADEIADRLLRRGRMLTLVIMASTGQKLSQAARLYAVNMVRYTALVEAYRNAVYREPRRFPDGGVVERGNTGAMYGGAARGGRNLFKAQQGMITKPPVLGPSRDGKRI